MEPKERIIVALDVDNVEKASFLVAELSPHVGGFKIGLEFINAALASVILPDDEWEAVKKLRVLRDFLSPKQRAQFFWDGKLMDIPNTVEKASLVISGMGVKMLNVHCLGGKAMMQAARKAAEETAKKQGIPRPMVLGVTILTSLNKQDLFELGFNTGLPAPIYGGTDKIVINLGRLAFESGLDGIIVSPEEATFIRREARLPANFLIVTPGIRPVWAATGDQKRVMTPKEAVKAGADYLVIGRPITQPPAEIGGPVEAAKRIAEEIGQGL